MTTRLRTLKYAPKVGIYAPDRGGIIQFVHAEKAQRLVRDGVAKRRGSGKRVREIEIIGSWALEKNKLYDFDDTHMGHLGGVKYTYRETISVPSPCHCIKSDGPNRDCMICKGRGVRMVAIGKVIQHKQIHTEDWPVFKASVIDCLPASDQAEIRRIFEEDHA